MNVQVQIVTWNSRHHLKTFFEALEKQTLKPASVICIDNNSSDGTKDLLLLQKNCQNIFLNSNTGFCHAHNIGFQKAIQNKDIDTVLICNPDVELHPQAIKNLMHAFQEQMNIGTVSGVLLRPGPLTIDSKIRIVDSAGIQKKFGFRFINRGEGQTFDEHFLRSNTEVFANSGACMMIPKNALIAISKDNHEQQFFDESFFAYKEDIDVGWRANKLGFKNICINSIIGYHERHIKKSFGYFKKTSTIIELSYRNHVRLLKKHYKFSEYPFELPGILFYEMLKILSLFIIKIFSESKKANK